MSESSPAPSSSTCAAIHEPGANSRCERIAQQFVVCDCARSADPFRRWRAHPRSGKPAAVAARAGGSSSGLGAGTSVGVSDTSPPRVRTRVRGGHRRHHDPRPRRVAGGAGADSDRPTSVAAHGGSLGSTHRARPREGLDMTSSLVATKFAAPRLRGRPGPAAPAGAQLMDAGSEATLTLVSGPRGLRQDAPSSPPGCDPRLDRAPRGGVRLPGPVRQPGLVLLALRRDRAERGDARRRCRRAASSRLGAACDSDRADRRPQRGRCPAHRGGPRPRRLPPRRRRRGGRRNDLRARASAAEPARRHQHPCRPRPRSRGCGRAESLSRSGPGIFASPPTTPSYYLTDVGGLPVAPAEVSALESRTEGWPAALQLAALSMQGRDDVGDFIAGFAGTDRHVVDYLVDEVLSQQSDEVRDFLERTSFLDLLGGGLCDAALERTGSRGMLERLERANLFLVPLDDQRRWYRYHHLFAEVLQAHLRSERPDLVPGLHLRASRWYEGIGEPVPAVRHALAAGDLDRAADLVETATPALRRDRHEATLRRWVDDFPDEVVQRRPVLALAFVGALMSSNDFADVARRLREIERQPSGDSRVPLGRRRRHESARHWCRRRRRTRSWPGSPQPSSSTGRGLSLVSGDLPATHRHARRAIDTAASDDDVVRAGAAGLSGLAHWAGGELDEAHRSYLTCIDGLLRAQHISDALGCYLTVADIQRAQGRLRDAQATVPTRREPGRRLGRAGHRAARRTSTSASAQAGPAARRPRYRSPGHLAGRRAGLGRRPRAAGVRLPLARRRGHARRGRGRSSPEPSRLVSAGAAGVPRRVFLAQRATLARRRPPGCRIRLGDLDAAERWARDHDVTGTQELSYLREFEHVTLAEALLAARLPRRRRRPSQPHRGRPPPAAAARRGGRRRQGRHRHRGLVLTVPTACAGDDLDGAVRDPRPGRAHGRQGEVRSFARHGTRSRMLEAPATSPGAPSVARPDGGLRGPARESTRSQCQRTAEPTASGGLAEVLSAREREVLTLLATELDGPEIARHLFVSLNTVRTHTKNIYAKLDVNDAVGARTPCRGGTAGFDR
ncbi:MAG: LuxR C-terminal-related transcriptional regulator [Desulfomicrobium escambiense]|nr:LuxR C-terminal-related transcriptional regulator [Desulfomicrobium escambiense]